MRTASVVIAICLTSIANAEEPERVEARAHFKQGVAAFEAQQYSQASAHFSAAYKIEPHADLLWSWAQAERFDGKCETAIDLYRKYEREAQTPTKASAARDMIALCERQLPPPRVPWYTNRLGGVLTASGVVGVTVGITFLALASSSRSAAKEQMYLDDFDAKLDEATLRRRIGAVSLSLGAGALVAGVVVYVIGDREQRTVTAGTDGRVVFVGGRF
jgi:tetratricopeptide (TPR) repeat protein